ncbi:MAG: ParB/RepB/Spo0J family partition protein [Bacteroidetes bacterium]|nr:ParB/RepB/Spo0J family partition protein [Bacteroidota bacterium]
MKTKKRALGRGLDAILQSPEIDIQSEEIAENYIVGAIANIPLDNIEANPFQPRDFFEEDSLVELGASIKEQGIIQPITVRKLGIDRFQLISGERRLRAAKLIGLEEIPCYIRVANDEQMLEMALIENIHRENLNAIEIAISYQRLIEECSLTHEQLSAKVGKKRATITNYLRLLKLPAPVQIALRDDKISMGHARALINITNEDQQVKILNKTIQKELSVRQVEDAVRLLNRERKLPPDIPDNFIRLQERFSSFLNTRVEVKMNNKGKGSIVIPIETQEDLDKILQMLEK